MSGYIDIHSHILPAIDDGPRTLGESVEMARSYVRAGFDTVVATPHSSEGDPAPSLIMDRLYELKGELERKKITLNILPGAEQHIEPATLERLQKGEILTLNQTRYFLLELPFFQALPPYTEELLFNLAASGYRPVIPHPERVVELQKDPGLVYRLHRAGALFQVTWGALNGCLGTTAGQFVRTMLDCNLAHFFATDAHSPNTHLLKIDEAISALDNKAGSGSAEQMLSARPRVLLADGELDLPPAREPGPHSSGKPPLIARFRRRIGR